MWDSNLLAVSSATGISGQISPVLDDAQRSYDAKVLLNIAEILRVRSAKHFFGQLDPKPILRTQELHRGNESRLLIEPFLPHPAPARAPDRICIPLPGDRGQ